MNTPEVPEEDKVVKWVNTASRNPSILLVVLVIMGFAVAYLAGQNQAYKASLALPHGTSAPVTTVAAAIPASSTPGPVETVQANDHVTGSRTAKVTLIEYSDLECPFCKQFEPTVEQIRKDYGDQVETVYRQFPLTIHQNAEIEAEASECAASVGGESAFWSYVSTIFTRTTSNGTGFSTDNLAPLAKELGINEANFQKCLDSGASKAKVQHDISTGTAAGVQGTPTSILLVKNHAPQLLPGALSYAQLKQDIDTALQQ